MRGRTDFRYISNYVLDIRAPPVHRTIQTAYHRMDLHSDEINLIWSTNDIQIEDGYHQERSYAVSNYYSYNVQMSFQICQSPYIRQ